MPRSFVDLSNFLEKDLPSDPPAFAPRIGCFTHENTCAQIEPFFPGLRHEDLPDGGVKLDFRHVADGYVVNAADVEAELNRIGHTHHAAGNRRRQHPRRFAPWLARPCVLRLRHGP